MIYLAFSAFILSLLTAYVTLSPMRRDLKMCERERGELKRQLEIVIAVIIRTLPREQRIELLADLDARVPPGDSDAGWAA